LSQVADTRSVGAWSCLYTGPRSDRLSARASTVLTAVILAGGLSLGGCSYNLSSGIGHDRDDAEVTGSIRKADVTKDSLVENSNPSDADLAFARQAASDALTKGGDGTSLPWENPQTGARGSITPLASAYTSDTGQVCRDFLASYVQGETQTWLQGDACQNDGRWQVHEMRPWKRT
jgi:surface antigen